MRHFVHEAIKRVCYFIYGYWVARRYRYASRQTINKRQSKKFNKLLQDVSRKSNFYQEYRNQTLKRLPIMNKKSFLGNFNTINTAGFSLSQCEEHGLEAENKRSFRSKINGVSVGLSSGTSAQRGLFLVSSSEQALWAGYILAKNIEFNFKRQKVALFLRANSNLYESANGRLIQFRYFDLSRQFSHLLHELEDYQPHILIAPAHVLGVLAEQRAKIKPSKIISVAEVLEDDTRKKVEREFNCRLDEIYQATEGYIASTCSHGSLHLNEDILIIEKEWLDKRHGRFIPIITDLNRRILPIIRQRLDDILVEDKTPCPCGSNFTRLKKIEGREDDMLWLPDSSKRQLRPVFPDTIRRAMYTCKHPLHDYRIEQNKHVIHISYESESVNESREEIDSSLSKLFEKLDLHKPRFQFHQGVNQSMNKKLRRISCKQKPTKPVEA